ncbi:hypothetical protein D3C86_2209500 [compost metagenome]
MPDRNRPRTPLQTVSVLVWPRMVICMIGRKFAGMYSNRAVSTSARQRLTMCSR